MAESARSVGMWVVGDPQLLAVPPSRAIDGRVAARSQPQRDDRPARLLGLRFGTSTCVVGGCIPENAPTATPHHFSRSKAITDADD